MNFSYFSGSTCVNKVASIPVRCKCIISSMSTCTNAPGMSHVTMSLVSLALIIQYRNIYSVTAVGDMVYSFVLYNFCFLPSAHLRPMIFPHHFCFRNIRYSRAFFFSSLVKMFVFYGCPTSWYCIFLISCRNYLNPSSPNIRKPLLLIIGRGLCDPDPSIFIVAWCIRSPGVSVL